MLFKILSTDNQSSARSGVITTGRSSFPTPVFMPVGTLGNVKGVQFKDLKEHLNFQVILGNAYHLYLRPGLEVLQKTGGLHKFTLWDRHILTDSGGYQVYSLAKNRKITEEGVRFQSHIDGSYHFISPETSVNIQRSIGADFIMAFDECTPYPVDFDYAKKSMELTHRWLVRCLRQFSETNHRYDFSQAFLPIVQGGTFHNLRKESALFVSEQNCSANAIGGLSVGEPTEIMNEITELVSEILPADKPRYLMGVGKPEDILDSVERGVDMFDCVIPTRNARHGLLYTFDGVINIKNEKWKFDSSPINQNALSFVDREYSKAFLRHLFVSGEILGPQIATLNNLAFYAELMAKIRLHIENGDFTIWKKEIKERISQKQ